jgi:hypothetical protein
VVFGTTDRGIEALRAHECDMKISFEFALILFTALKRNRKIELDRINRNYKYDYPIEKVVSAVLIPELTEAE